MEFTDEKMVKSIQEALISLRKKGQFTVQSFENALKLVFRGQPGPEKGIILPLPFEKWIWAEIRARKQVRNTKIYQMTADHHGQLDDIAARVQATVDEVKGRVSKKQALDRVKMDLLARRQARENKGK